MSTRDPMSVRVTTERGRLVVDVRAKAPDGTRIRERQNVPTGMNKAAAHRWGIKRQAHLTINGREKPVRIVPSLAEFGPRWVREYARANALKPSTIHTYETHLRLHLYPVLGPSKLDAIHEPAIQRVKLHLEKMSGKTRACILSTLANILGTAERWGEIDKAPTIEVKRWQEPTMDFYDFKEWEALIDGAARAGPMVLCCVLLGGDAGLRRGELVALEQTDVGPGECVNVRRNEWEGEVGAPKGGQSRRIPCTSRLAEALAAVKHLRGKRLLWQANGARVGVPTLQSWLEVACRRAGLPESRNLHKLRHTFVSHLMMRGVPIRQVQEWAGHADIKTTMRYAHLSPHGMDDLIHVLEKGAGGEHAKPERAI